MSAKHEHVVFVCRQYTPSWDVMQCCPICPQQDSCFLNAKHIIQHRRCKSCAFHLMSRFCNLSMMLHIRLLGHLKLSLKYCLAMSRCMKTPHLVPCIHPVLSAYPVPCCIITQHIDSLVGIQGMSSMGTQLLPQRPCWRGALLSFPM